MLIDSTHDVWKGNGWKRKKERRWYWEKKEAGKWGKIEKRMLKNGRSPQDRGGSGDPPSRFWFTILKHSRYRLYGFCYVDAIIFSFRIARIVILLPKSFIGIYRRTFYRFQRPPGLTPTAPGRSEWPSVRWKSRTGTRPVPLSGRIPRRWRPRPAGNRSWRPWLRTDNGS